MTRAEQAVRARVARWGGLMRLAGQHLAAQARSGLATRVSLSVAVVATAIALLVLVTSVSLGLATQSTVYGSDVDYWIAPEGTSGLTAVTAEEGPRLGDVHERTRQVRSLGGVTYATPVLVEIVQVRAPGTDRPEFLVALGVIPPDTGAEIAGISTAALTPADPYYANGTYDGAFTGEVVLSSGAASLLNGSEGDSLTVMSTATGATEYSYKITATTGSGTIQGDVPVALVHLSELQELTGAADGDQADQLLVQTTSPGVRSDLEDVYPQATVSSREGLGARDLVDSDLPLAVSVTALLTSLVVATLSIATTAGLEVEADRRLLALLAAVGIPMRGRLVFVAALTLGLALLGGLVGVLSGAVGIAIVNHIATTQFGTGRLAAFHPGLAVYGLAIAGLAGLLAVPYPLLIARRTNVLDELGR